MSVDGLLTETLIWDKHCLLGQDTLKMIYIYSPYCAISTCNVYMGLIRRNVNTSENRNCCTNLHFSSLLTPDILAKQ